MTVIDLSTNLAGFSLSNCIYNASGAKCMTETDLLDLIKSDSGALVTKSCTISPREGNPEPRYVDLDYGSINSMGLPNGGVDFYTNFIDTHQPNKAVFLSVAGLSLEENVKILKRVQFNPNITAVELNLSCPNIPGKPQTAYDFERTKEVLEEVFSFYDKPLGVKLPPYFDLIHFEQMANILNQFPLQFVTCINSIGNGLFIDTDAEAVVIKPKEGFGGIGGDYIKPTALANVRMFYKLLRKDIDIVGCGGIKSGLDVFEHILCGATAVQIGSQLMKEGMPTFTRITTELSEIMQKKGYQSINEFKGELKSFRKKR
jgi:dihydroorotate dehydrogenase (fumarate)